MKDLQRGSHSVYMLQYHLILVVKYRRNVINDEIFASLGSIFSNIGSAYNVAVIVWNHDAGHIHVLFQASPITHLSGFINTYKSASSRIIKLQYPEIKNSLWRSMFWPGSYCLLSTGGASVDVIRNYITNQGKEALRHVSTSNYA